MILITSDGAKRELYSNKPNGMIVPNKMTVEIERTTPPVITGGSTHTGRYALNNTPAIKVPQPRIGYNAL